MAKGFDLPTDEVKGYINDLMEQIGDEVVIDYTQTTKVMIADLERVYDNLQQNMKRTVLRQDINIKRGSRLDFKDGRIGIVFTSPNDDIVSLSAQILVCNSKPEILSYGELYDNDPKSKTYGDTIDKGLVHKCFADGFIERIDAKENQYDVGILHDAVLRFITFQGTDVALEDILIYHNKNYRVIDIDDITDGILVIQLASVRK